MLPDTKSLRNLNKFLVGSGFQIRKPWNSYILENEDGQYLTRRKTLADMKLELERRLAAGRLEYLRGELRAERISQGELCELTALAPYIEAGDVELLEAAGVPEFRDDPRTTKEILDGIVGQLNILICRHVVSPNPAHPTPPDWFVKELQAIDFTANTMQSAIDNPEGADYSFAHK